MDLVKVKIRSCVQRRLTLARSRRPHLEAVSLSLLSGAQHRSLLAKKKNARSVGQNHPIRFTGGQ